MRFRVTARTTEVNHSHQHGWLRTLPRQRVHRTALALAQIRTDPSGRFRRWHGSPEGARPVLRFLQLPATSSAPRLQDARRTLPAESRGEENDSLIGAPPQTPGFIALWPEWTVLLFPDEGHLPYHQIAWREDRATQGCDPSAAPGPDGGSPSPSFNQPLHLRNSQKTVQALGSTSRNQNPYGLIL